MALFSLSALRSSGAPARGGRIGAGTDPQSGAAFLLILILAALLSAGVVAYLSLSTRRLSEKTAEAAGKHAESLALLARAALVVGLKNEMAAGFANPIAPGEASFLQVSGPAGAVNLLYPANAQAAVPARSGPQAPPNLVKWSTRLGPFYAETVAGTFPWRSRFPPAAPASPVSTLDSSANGKIISTKRWNAAWLLPKQSPGGTDPTPATFPVPDWVCVNARGEQRDNLAAQKTDPIVGRYAYLVFDEGALLDASVAGHDSKLSPAVVAAKASTRAADLRVLMEASGFSASEATVCNDAFVRWRDPGFLGNNAANYSDLLGSVGPSWPGRLYPGNRTLVSRRALIRLMLDSLPGPLPARQNVLQYLGTFSRSLAQPQNAFAWPRLTPPILSPEKGGNDGAGWNESYPNPVQHLNPPFAMVRVKTPFMRDNGTSALPGEPLLKARFPLARLDMVQSGATAAVGSRTEKLFGLSRSEAHVAWSYRPSQTRILTLHEVAELPGSAAREPDFVELLKASIQAGCLAKSSGNESLPPDDSLDEAILQIAANIIDQADADAFPTRIRFVVPGGPKIVSGIENLPYLSGVATRVGLLREALPTALLRTPEGKPSPIFSKIPAADTGEMVLWQAVQLWNPHEISMAMLSQKRPVEFRVSVEATNQFSLQLIQETPMLHAGTAIPGADPSPAEPGSRVSGEHVRFRMPQDAVAAFYQPEWLVSTDKPGGLETQLGPFNLLPPAGLSSVDGSPVFGLGLARCAQVFETGVAPGRYTVRPSMVVPIPAVQLFYRLEYNLGAAGEEPNWVAYDEKMGLPLKQIPLEGSVPVDFWPDPRSGRFGSIQAVQDVSEAQVRAHFFQNTGASPGDYADADGVHRRGAGAAGNAASPLGRDGRPRMLDRPLRSVGELAFAFAGTPWRQLDFATPESGFSGLLETFSAAENTNPEALESGRMNLNTRQVPVLQAVLAGADLGVGDPAPAPLASTGEFSALSLARAIVARTGSLGSGMGPLQSLCDLVGHRGVDGRYSGIAADLKVLFEKAPKGGTSAERHAIARSLAACGDTRVWNLLFDIIAQSGRFPPGAEKQGDLRNFVVEGEHRIWVHIAMDRLTGEVLDLQTEEVAE